MNKIVDYKIQSVEPIDSDYYVQSGRKAPFKMFLDTNVIVDVILKNQRYKASEPLFEALWQLSNEGIVEIVTSTVCIVEAIYQLGDLSLFKRKGEELLQELAENINDPEMLKSIIIAASKERRSNIGNISLKHWRNLEKLLKKYKITIASPSDPDRELIQLAYKENIQTQDLLIFISALGESSDILLTNDKNFYKRVERLGEMENYIFTRSLCDHRATKTTLKTLRDEGVILSFKIAKMEGKE